MDEEVQTKTKEWWKDQSRGAAEDEAPRDKSF